MNAILGSTPLTAGEARRIINMSPYFILSPISWVYGDGDRSMRLIALSQACAGRADAASSPGHHTHIHVT
jgi:hypothetical protein